MPDTGGVRSSASSARTYASSNASFRHISTAPNFVGSKGSGGVHSSNLLASSSKLKAPTKNDAEKMLHRSLTSNASTGGNGIRRPYGRFIASRGGLTLSVWERQAPNVSRGGQDVVGNTKANVSSPYFPQVKQNANRTAAGSPGGKSAGRNVSKYNVKRKAYTSRNMDISSTQVESKYNFQGTDTINFSNSSVVDMPLFSRPRPEGMSSLPAQRSSGSVGLTSSNSSSYVRLMHSTYRQLPAATFLTHIPKVPKALRVDCGQTCAKQFLTKSQAPIDRPQHGGKSSSIHSLPSYHGHRSAAYLGSDQSNLKSPSTTSFINFSSNSLKSLSNLELPEVLSGALSLNINELEQRSYGLMGK